jgi:hypothetical protein
MCMFCRSLFVLLSFFFWPLCYLFFDIRILITPLVSSNSSYLSSLFYLIGPDQCYSIHKYFLPNKLDIYVSIDLLKDSLIISTSTLFSQFLTHFSPICYFRATKQQKYITYDYNKILGICLWQIILTQFPFVMTKRLNNWQITLDLFPFMAATSCYKGLSLVVLKTTLYKQHV